ncbi:MAG: hypothetical protein H6617_06060 [Bdellovibrionaceae bacterium]|nr:hypothetical protein [Bdellovibrionales bacterium]MCB9254228.1 hypothetical protein [Pseudobdellovibrionaceae bacterium]
MLLFSARGISALLALFSLLILVPRLASAEERVRGRTQVVLDSEESTSRFSVGGGVAVLEGVDGANVGFGGSVGFAFRVGPGSPVFLGMDVGYNYWNVRIKEQQNGTEVTRNASLNSFQMLASIYYRFLDNQAAKAHPYIGFSIGPNLMSGDDKIKMGGNSVTAGGSQVALQMYFRPGVEFDVSRNVSVNFESRVGLLEGNLMFAPQVNAIFSF